MAHEHIVNSKDSNKEIRGLLTKKCDNIEDKINELRGLLSTINLVFLNDSNDENTDLYFASKVIKDKFKELAVILGYGSEANTNRLDS